MKKTQRRVRCWLIETRRNYFVTANEPIALELNECGTHTITPGHFVPDERGRKSTKGKAVRRGK